MRHALAVIFGGLLCASASAQGPLPSILLVGYLPPTNEMLRQFSTNPAQNPGLWTGANWENRGYNIFAYFPEFPQGSQCMGVGDFEIDYQDTTADFNRITQQLHPVVILTLSVGASTLGWGLEPAYQRWSMPGEVAPAGSHPIPIYLPDCTGFRYPYNSPVLADRPGRVRFSNLPMQSIAASVGSTIPPSSLAPFVYPYDPRSSAANAFCGNYLSGYIAYLAAKYREINQPPVSLTPCYMTGHVHVGYAVQPSIGAVATEITLREVIATLSTMNNTVQMAGGACCDSEGDSCMYALASTCTGLFLGAGTACQTTNCPAIATGSCCLIDGTCTVLPHSLCDDGPRIWFMGGSCSAGDCAPGIPGVCCRGATCNTVIGPGVCSTHGTAAGAVYSLLGDACEPLPGHPTPCCHADYNKNGFISTIDLLDYLHDWFDASPFASVGTDGASDTPTTTNIFDFLTVWFNGCQ